MLQPEFPIKSIVDGKPVFMTEPLFPGYICFRIREDAFDYRQLRYTRGVIRILSFNGKPAFISDEIIGCIDDILRSRALLVGKGEPITRCLGKESSQRIKAIFDASDGEERAMLLMSFLHIP